MLQKGKINDIMDASRRWAGEHTAGQAQNSPWPLPSSGLNPESVLLGIC